MAKRHFRSYPRSSGLGVALLLTAIVIAPLSAQSNHAAALLAGGTWRLHSRVPLGFDALLLQPAHLEVQILATAEAPELEGWTLTDRQGRVVLLDATGRAVQALPRSIIFRITVGTHAKFGNLDPMPVDCSKSLNDFLLDMHFRVQVFRGMQMREFEPSKTWMIGVPADETSDERVYRSAFDLGDLCPEDRIVLLITDATGTRLSKFHLEFL